MRSVRGTRARIAVLVSVLMVCSLSAAMAQNAGGQEDRSVFYGQVTAIDGASVTIAIGTVSVPQMPAQGGNSGGQQNGAPRGGGMGGLADSFAPTGEYVTVMITEAVTLTKQGARMQSGQPGEGRGAQPQGTPPAGNLPQGTPPAGGDGGNRPEGMGFGGQGEAAALSDLEVGSYVILTYQTSTQALLSVHILGSSGATAS